MDKNGECKKVGCPAKTIEVTAGGKKLCVTQYNMGDQSEFPLTGANTVYTNGTKCSSSSACCWKGVTSDGCNASNGGYSGCNRTVCNHAGADIVCSNLKYDNKNWRLPTVDELAYFASYSKNKGSTGLMLCDTYAGYGSAQCLMSENGCNGAYEKDCNPNRVWSSNLGSGNYAYSYGLGKGSWEKNSYSRKRARSVRCVTEFKE